MPRPPIPYRSNFAWVLVLECAWAVGTWLASPVTVLPQFLLRLGGSAAWVALLPGLWALGSGLGALFLGPLVAHRRHVSAFAGWMHYVALLAWPALGLVAHAVDRGWLTPARGLPLSLLVLLAFDLVMGVILQLYFLMLSRVFPERGRGRWFSALFAVSSVVGTLGPVLAARWFIREDARLADYGNLFIATGALFAAGSFACFRLVEQPGPVTVRRTFAGNLRTLRDLWRAHAALRSYLRARFLLELGAMCGAFMATYGRTEAGFSEHVVASFGTVFVAALAVSCILLGALATRLETRRTSAVRTYLLTQGAAQALSLLALLAAAVGPAGPATWAIVAAAGLRVGADLVIHPNILIELGG